MNIPDVLVAQVRQGSAALLLGAGASYGAIGPSSESPPDSRELGRLLSQEFLGGEHQDDPLHVVSELAISEADLFTVQEYIRHVFDEFQPAEFHKRLATFRWHGIATTNFDLVVERAYAASSSRAQDLIPLRKNGDRVEDHLRSPDALLFLKLHGCITRTADPEIPLILTVDQYITHRRGRNRLFDHLRGWAYEHPIVFIGHSLLDADCTSSKQVGQKGSL